MSHSESHTGLIWKVFGILSVVTIIEVGFGIVKPDFLFFTSVAGTSLLNWIFLILTIVKAYYIAWDFMHIRDEKSSLKNSIVLPLVFLIPYLAFIILLEADYIFDIMKDGIVSWDF